MTSPLHARLARLLSESHSRPPEPLWQDWRPPIGAVLRPAAVLIAVTERVDHPDGPGLLFIQRPTTMRAHPGQAAFPGGKIDPGETPVEAALREANEELGIDPALVQVIGTTDRFRTGTGYDITPVLATVPADMPLVPNPHEVAAWFEPPFAFVLDPANHKRRSTEFDGQARSYIEILWREHRIWGVTGGIIANLARRIRWADNGD